VIPMKSNKLLQSICLLVMMVSFFPTRNAQALVSAPPPADMFQLPWDQGIAWVAIDGIDNGSKRPLNSSHNYHLGGAIDFAPKAKMFTGEDTSKYWVTAAAAGTVIQISSCDLSIVHADGWVTQYQFLGNMQVKLGDIVARNQRLAIIADGVRQKYCPGYSEINVPHLHFVLRPSILDATFAGWQVKYNSLLNVTIFKKGLIVAGLYQPLMNVMEAPTPTPTTTATSTPTSTPTQVVTPTPITGPYVSTTIDPRNIEIGGTALVTVSLNNVPAEGYMSTEFTCSYAPNLLEVSNIQIASLFGADPASAINGPGAQSFIVAIAASDSNKATTSGTAFTFQVKGMQTGQTTIECKARVSQGNNTLTEIPFVTDSLTILGNTPTPTSTPPSMTDTPTSVPGSSTNTPTPTSTPGGPTPTPTSTPGSDWIPFINTKYGFQFLYPNGSQLLAGATDTYARINLPIVPGTNLSSKYLEVIVAENFITCQSPLTTNPDHETSETVVINGISWLKQTGSDATTGHINIWNGYSASRDNVCVSLDFVMRAADPGDFTTPPPLFDQAAESAVFGQIVGTYTWFTVATPTSTGLPTATSTPTQNGTPTTTSTSTSTATPSGQSGTAAGQITVSKPVTINLYDANNVLVATTESLDGNFSIQVLPGTYKIVAVASGFLSAQRMVSIAIGTTSTLPPLTLLAGDIDGNNVIDQFDAMTIGMDYNSAVPDAADLNGDGIINVLDLELLAKNYRKTGPTPW
jgi:murein DD-endopeptidase MepM/ murein hydrolase activator NlpD